MVEVSRGFVQLSLGPTSLERETEDPSMVTHALRLVGNQVEFTLGNAEDLHTIPSNSIDLYTIAFGIRNVTHIDLALKEAYRVLKPGGVFSCLEFSKVSNPLLAQFVPPSYPSPSRTDEIAQDLPHLLFPSHPNARSPHSSRPRLVPISRRVHRALPPSSQVFKDD